MKAIKLTIAALLLTTSAATARDYAAKEAREWRRSKPEVLFVLNGGSQDQSVVKFNSAGEMEEYLTQRACKAQCVKDIATEQFAATQRTGYQSTETPLLLFTQKENKFSFGVGGYINLRTSYDFNGVVENIDFIPADIPTQSTYATRQQLMMDASTSRLYFKGLANTHALGQVEIFVDMDFRGNVGYDGGVTNSYQPRLRCAYASFLGFTIGRDITTFCDLDAAPKTIDFQGPNAYSFNYATLLRYTHSFCNDRWEAAIALEQPNVSGTYDDKFNPMPQRMPDIPLYIEYKLGANRNQHIRASGVFRNMYVNNASTGNNTSIIGWGVKLSGHLTPAEWFGLCFNGTYGEGITPYIQDLNDSGLDFTPNPENPSSIQTMPMYGWQAAANFNLTDRLTATAGYSMVEVEKHNGFYTNCQYKRGRYVFANLFYSITPRFEVACEYLYGSRRDMNCLSNTANRASVMAQFSF